MKKSLIVTVVSVLLPTLLNAQTIDRKKYPDYSDKRNPDYSLMHPLRSHARSAVVGKRPDHVNNAETMYFPPVFNQDGGSCGSASRIGYMFTYEMDAFRRRNAQLSKNQYPTHFVWLLTNGNSGKDDFVQHIGVPSADTYGGRTYSKLFGNQEESQDDFGWMTGYNKWYEAMFNRMLKPANFPQSTGTDEGREALKNWLWNHNGDTDFASGGLAGIGVAAGTMSCSTIASTPTNDALGVTGKACVGKWGTGVDHALTIVGYDDRVEFDLNGNGIYGEKSADECGAWIIVNSWGNEWASGGFVYCPYAYGGSHFNKDGSFSNDWWYPEIYKVRKNYRPLRTIKVKMDYSRRSELYLMAGVSKDLNATYPEQLQALDHFKYAGDGNNGNTIPAPEIPMLGRWADGKLHTEAMEFGYDLTDLSAQFDENESLKYFFIINTKPTAQGRGHIYNASIIDYAQDSLGLEVPFDIAQNGVSIQNKGEQTILSIIVPGRGIKAPCNVAVANGQLQWEAPTTVTSQTLTGYKVIHHDEVLATLPATSTSYALPDGADGAYGVKAVYGNKESNVVNVMVSTPTKYNQSIRLTHNGFTLPGVFTSKYQQATIEFWTRPQSLADWNQSVGPGWGTFMFHANANGTFTAGWNTNARLNIASALKVNQWSHIALVIDGNTLTAYVNGVNKGTITSTEYSGIGGFGDFTFLGNDEANDQNTYYDELRIWRTARTANEIKANYQLRYADGLLPDELIAYYPGDLLTLNGSTLLRDHTTNCHHAAFVNSNFAINEGWAKSLKYVSKSFVKVASPSAEIIAGQPVELHALGSTNLTLLRWTAQGALANGVAGAKVRITFKQAGEQPIHLEATDINGKVVTADTTLQVLAAPQMDASFKVSQASIACGDRVSFIANQQLEGYQYQWRLDGATYTSSTLPCITASYEKSGNYKVALTLTDAQGHTATSEQTISVKASAPRAAFDVEPSVVVKGNEVKLTDCSAYGSQHSIWTLTNGYNVMQGDGSNIAFYPTLPGVYDVTLQASNEAGNNSTTMQRALTICNADSKTGLNFMPAATARLNLSQVPLTASGKKFTIDWWMRSNALTNVCNGIGQDTQTLQLQTLSTGAMRLYLKGKHIESAAGYVVPNEWHHYAVTFNRSSVNFMRDGAIFTSAHLSQNNVLPTLTSFTLGSDDAPMNGMVDEFRVWDGVQLNENKLHSYITEPLTEATIAQAEADGLKVYYKFDQSSGNATDATSNANMGVRSGFGPDGDAWSSSKGVFALNFTDNGSNVTESYLKNAEAPFAHSSKMVNSSINNRFMTLTGWQLRGMVTEGSVTTGAHVDMQKGSSLTITIGWDGFASQLTNHKVYQTLNLPQGVYVFTAHYDDYEGQASGCYLVATAADTLVSTSDLFATNPIDLLAYKAMEGKSSSVTANSISFVLTEPTTVSLGLLANMQGKQCLSLGAFELTRYPLLPLEGKIDDIHNITIQNPDELNQTVSSQAKVFDLSGRRIQVPSKGVFIIGHRKVLK